MILPTPLLLGGPSMRSAIADKVVRKRTNRRVLVQICRVAGNRRKNKMPSSDQRSKAIAAQRAAEETKHPVGKRSRLSEIIYH
jgi:hypothetical protein